MISSLRVNRVEVVLFLTEYLLLKQTLLFQMYFLTGLSLSFGISHLTEQCVEVGFYKARAVHDFESFVLGKTLDVVPSI